MKIINKLWAILFLQVLACLMACTKDSIGPARDYHQLNTYAATNIEATSATFSAEILNAGKEPILEHGFVWAKTKPFLEQQGTQVAQLGGKTGTGKFSTTVQDQFERNTVYYVRPFVKTATYTVYGLMVSFTAKP